MEGFGQDGRNELPVLLHAFGMVLYVGVICRPVANVFLGGILSGRKDNEETMDYVRAH